MFVVVLDANVLFPMVLRDTLLRLAQAGAFRLHWSERILEEMTRNLVKVAGLSEDTAQGLRETMEEAFEDAMVRGWEPREAEMPNHPKDRHVAAAAVTIGANLVVTSNLKDFKHLPVGLQAWSPDQFLLALLADDPLTILSVLRHQAAGYCNPKLTVYGLLNQLRAVVPGFVAAAPVLLQAGP